MLRSFNFKFAYCTFFSHFSLGILKASSTVSGVKKWQSLKIEGRKFSNLFFNRSSKLDIEIKRKKKKIISLKFDIEITIPDHHVFTCF